MFGLIKEKDIKPGIVKSNIGKEFLVFDANFSDNISNIKRGPAIAHPKDIGLIIKNSPFGGNLKNKNLLFRGILNKLNQKSPRLAGRF